MRRLSLLLLAVGLTAVPALAQTPNQRVRLVGFSLDHWRGATGPALLRPTVRLTTYSPRGPGAEFAVVVFPDGISINPPGLALGLQAGLAQPIAVGPVTVLAKAGGAGIAVTGILADGKLLHIIPGVQAGLGVLVPVDRKSTLRLDVSRHIYKSAGYTHGVWSFGVGVAGGLRRPR